MTIPEGYFEWTALFGGPAAPNGAQISVGFVELVGEPIEDVHDALDDMFVVEILPRLTDELLFIGSIVKMGPEDTGARYEVTRTGAGTQDAEAVPPNVALLVYKNTGVGGRRGRGRFFLPGYAEDGVDGSGTVAGAGVAANNAALADWKTAMEDYPGGELVPVLFHSPATEWVLVDGQPRRVPVAGAVPAPTPINSFTSSGTVATQRRRLR